MRRKEKNVKESRYNDKYKNEWDKKQTLDGKESKTMQECRLWKEERDNQWSIRWKSSQKEEIQELWDLRSKQEKGSERQKKSVVVGKDYKGKVSNVGEGQIVRNTRKKLFPLLVNEG